MVTTYFPQTEAGIKNIRRNLQQQFQKYNKRTRIILAFKNKANLYKLLNKNKKN